MRFDHVVVGAGSAGAVLAARLSEHASRTVLLLEAGANHTSADTPAGTASPNFFTGLGVDGRLWPELVATRIHGQPPSLYVHGRGVGGSSSVNAMIGMRGVPADYDHWATDLGCPGWGWAGMRPLLVRAEREIGLERVPAEAQPGFDRAVVAAARALGYAEIDDYHEAGATGISRCAFTIRDNRRFSTNDAYLEPARGRPNLTIRGDALVDRVALDGRRAVGVLTADGEEIEAASVIVSAGAIHSPAILLRSGIGPNVDLPVGGNLIDHVMTAGFEVALVPEARMTSSDVPALHSIIRYSSGLAGGGENDMQLLWFNAVGDDEAGRGGARVLGAVMQPFSRGTVRLRSDDPLVDPEVEFRLLADDRDRVRLRDAVWRVLDVLHHPYVAAVSNSVSVPGESIEALASDAAIDAWLDTNASDYVHAVGTCRMGTPGDPAAVVDPTCAVIGYEGLRVCDASVMPDIPRANTHLTTVAIAEGIATRVTADAR